MNALMEKARKEKIAELRRLMQELIADGDEAMTEEGLADAMEEAGESGEDMAEEAAMEGETVGEEMAEEAEDDELSAMRREFFAPKKPKPPRDGAAMMIAKYEAKSPKKGRRSIV